jgi:hypothetical protein
MKLLTIESGKANMLGLLYSLPAILLFGGLYFLLWHQQTDLLQELKAIKSNSTFALLLVILFVVFHELLHALAYLVLKKGDYKNIRFGIIWRSLTPYCHYARPVKVWQYRVALALPGIVLGVLPLTYALATGNFPLFVFALMMTLGALGDLLILLLLRKEPANALVKDHPKDIGCIILENAEEEQTQ